jgi:SAM-dependent methyltransferase
MHTSRAKNSFENADDRQKGREITRIKNFIPMTSINQLSSTSNFPWFKRWFNSVYYHKLYGNRDEQEAADFINELTGYLQPAPRSTMLDLGCGAGRHSRRLASKGFLVTGIDLSSSSIREAKKSETESLHFLRRDMRAPFGYNHFNYVFNFFTSFGYFKTRHENNLVVRNISNALKKDGTVVLDYMNVRYAEERLVPSEKKEIDGIHYDITRWLDEKFIYKKIVIDTEQPGEPFENIEQVARFTLHDFNQMFYINGLQVEEVFGDYALNNFDLNLSPRLIMVAKKAN